MLLRGMRAAVLGLPEASCRRMALRLLMQQTQQHRAALCPGSSLCAFCLNARPELLRACSPGSSLSSGWYVFLDTARPDKLSWVVWFCGRHMAPTGGKMDHTAVYASTTVCACLTSFYKLLE
jgi:hypothetical protein